MGDHGRPETKSSYAQPAKVLVVDDSRLVRAVVARALKGGGFHVEEADCGATALKMLSQGSYDVVITDLRMPGVDGFEVLAGVKRVDPNVEVIILTGTHAQDVSCAVRALRLGAHDYLTKPPSSADAVILTVERAVEKKRLKDANQRLLRELQTLSRTDALTGVPNRRSFDANVAQEVARARRHGHPLGVVMLDIDHFKKINDTHGHQGGDEVLRTFAQAVASVLREGDALYRFGGEEFVVVLPHADLAGATGVANRILAAVAAASVRIGTQTVGVTTSAGIACLAGCRDVQDLLGKADAALYAAKNGGRNRAVASGHGLTLIAGSRTA